MEIAARLKSNKSRLDTGFMIVNGRMSAPGAKVNAAVFLARAVTVRL